MVQPVFCIVDAWSCSVFVQVTVETPAPCCFGSCCLRSDSGSFGALFCQSTWDVKPGAFHILQCDNIKISHPMFLYNEIK